MFSIIVAYEKTGGIARKNKLPWKRLADDLKSLYDKIGEPDTSVIVGRKTYDIIHRLSAFNHCKFYVLTSGSLDGNSVAVVSVADALNKIAANGDCKGKTYVLGGQKVYEQAMNHPACQYVFATEVHARYECDVFFPVHQLQSCHWEVTRVSNIIEEHSVSYQFKTYSRRHEEHQYLDLMRQIVRFGNERSTRNATTVSLFGRKMTFNLRNGTFPLLTTKRLFWRGIFEELAWFIKGSTNANELSEKGVRIWEGNSSRQYLDAMGFIDREVGDCGPIYSHSWRHYGASYVDMHTDYNGKGVDQLKEVVRQLKNDPTSRRIIVNSWNPSVLDQVVLPPCHALFQFYVEDGELSCQVYQRSCDFFLGCGFNIASYSLLTIMMAHVCGLQPGEFHHVLGDVHLYDNSLEAARLQLTREPKPFPTLTIKGKVESIDDFKFDDFVLQGYEPHPAIKVDMIA